MTRKDIQFIAICVGAAALVVIAAHLLWPPSQPESPNISTYRQQEPASADTAEYTYFASQNSEVFHKPHCRYVGKIHSYNLIGFKSREDAVNSGRRPCKVCGP